MRLTIWCVPVTLLWLTHCALAGGLGGPWILRNPPTVILNPTGITYGGGQFVIVGGNGAMVRSPDGVSWTVRNSGTTNGLSAVSYGNSRFVAVGGPTILTSSNGVVWSQQNAGGTNRLYAVGYGNGQFAAVGAAGTIVTAPDGVNWTSQNSGTTDDLYGVAYNTNWVVAVGYYTGTVLTSADAVTWSLVAAASPFLAPGLVAYGDGRFVMVGGDGEADRGSIGVSTNGLTWTWQSPYGAKMFRGIAYGAGRFVAVDEVGVTWTSTDGSTWTAPGPTIDLLGVSYGAGQFAAVGKAGTILTSPDGVIWTQRQSGTSNDLSLTAGCENGFAVVLGSSNLLSSPDGITWTLRNAGSTNGFFGVAAGGGHFVAIGQGGSFAFSTDAVTWDHATLVPNLSLIDIAYGDNGFFAIGNDTSGPFGLALTSPDGGNWQLTRSWQLSPLNSITWPTNSHIATGGGLLLVAGLGSTLISTNGLGWTTGGWPSFYSGLPLVHGKGLFLTEGVFHLGCLCPYDYYILGSPDGVNWFGLGPGTTSELTGVAYGNHRLVVVGLGGTIFESEDAPELRPIRFLANGNVEGTIADVAATNCVIQTSVDLTTWSLLTNVVTTNGSAQFNDPAAGTLPRRFYRAVSP